MTSIPTLFTVPVLEFVRLAMKKVNVGIMHSNPAALPGSSESEP